VGTDELRIIGYYRLHPGLLDCPSYLRRNSFWTSLSRGNVGDGYWPINLQSIMFCMDLWNVYCIHAGAIVKKPTLLPSWQRGRSRS
jgi:hypothetical protein